MTWDRASDAAVSGTKPERVTEGVNFKRIGAWRDGWLVKVVHQHRTTNAPDLIWVTDNFFDLSETDQIAEIERIKPFNYHPVDSTGGYMTAWYSLFKRNDFDAIPGEESDELLRRVIDRFGAFSLEWYFAQVIGLIETNTGWEEGTTKFPLLDKAPQPIPGMYPESQFSAGFRAGYLMAEGQWKHGYEIHALRGQLFDKKNTAPATKARGRRKDANEQWIIDVSQKALDLGFGRFKSGKINQRDLARRCLRMNSPVKETRVRQIIRAAVRNDKLA